MLTKIEKLGVEDIRIFSGRHEYEFGKGITLIHGDNGKGKSTLGTMVMLTLIQVEMLHQLVQVIHILDLVQQYHQQMVGVVMVEQQIHLIEMLVVVEEQVLMVKVLPQLQLMVV